MKQQEREIKFRAWDKHNKCFNFVELPYINSAEYNNNSQENLMQFTGLKDKNEKEIYESDIFNCMYKEDGCSCKLLIIWDKSLARFRTKRYGVCDQPNVTQSMLDIQRNEVISNIYENPKLLEKTNDNRRK